MTKAGNIYFIHLGVSGLHADFLFLQSHILSTNTPMMLPLEMYFNTDSSVVKFLDVCLLCLAVSKPFSFIKTNLA